MEIIVIILAVLQCGTLGVLVAIYRQRAIDETLTKVYTNTDALQQALSAHKTSVDGLPKNLNDVVKEEVRAGLQPLVDSIEEHHVNTSKVYSEMAERLVKTHQAFVEMLSQVAHFDTMPGWLNRIEETIQPLKAIAENTLTVQGQNENIFSEANKLIVDYREKGEKVNSSYTSLTEKMEEWLGHERTFRSEFTSSVGDHLQNINGLQQKIENVLGEIGTFTTSIENVFNELERNLPKAVTALTAAGKGHQALEAKLENTIKEMHVFSNQIAEKTKQTVDNQQDLEKNMNSFLTKFQMKLDQRPWWKRILSRTK
jgi:chromosome segregation ATPase